MARTRSSDSLAVSTASSCPHVRIIHFNDVYNIKADTRDPVGGIARFQTVLQKYSSMHPGQPPALTLFSGDALNPSLESIFTKGEHMVKALNKIGVNFACLDNHELDFGVPHFQKLSEKCNFPWLCANVLDSALGKDVPLGGCKKTALVNINGVKIGLIGLVEQEWLATVNVLPPDLIFHSASATAAALVPALKDQGADVIIALTHQREPNDIKLAQKCAGLIDLILAGHDHFYSDTLVNGKGNPREVSGGDWAIKVSREDIIAAIPEDPAMSTWVDGVSMTLRAQLEQPVGKTVVDLDARFTTVRRGESNMGNFITDSMRRAYGADCCIISSGTMRGDQVYPAGLLTMRDIRNW
ncbi:hypothetical protein G6011_01027 [Alternaria panax]|uniref:Uncharacterized protein n=1 Tax=Alternaria panax TaxID=48097 RepID=A0AAD4NU67_9PLEO|nr:hypothetical protein G6011_01027 [Alternaria panax]